MTPPASVGRCAGVRTETAGSLMYETRWEAAAERSWIETLTVAATAHAVGLLNASGTGDLDLADDGVRQRISESFSNFVCSQGCASTVTVTPSPSRPKFFPTTVMLAPPCMRDTAFPPRLKLSPSDVNESSRSTFEI